MPLPLSRNIYFEELNEQAQNDIFQDLYKEIKDGFIVEFGVGTDWNVKLKELYFFSDDKQVEQFINNLVVARITEEFRGTINY